MLMRSRTVALVSLLVGTAWVMSSACSSSNKKKVLSGEDAGAAGEVSNAGSGGTVGSAGAAGAPEAPAAPDNAGAAGMRVAEGGAAGMEASAAGSGGTPSEAGSPPIITEAGAAGMAGAAPVIASTCVPSGTVTNFQLDPLNGPQSDFPILCRGSNLRSGFHGDASDGLTCCALSDATPAYAVQFSGTSNHDGGGSFDYTLPADAPLDEQTLTLTCPGVSQPTLITVVDPPVVLSTSSPVEVRSVLTITGTDLANVRYVSLEDGEAARDCSIVDQTDTTILCTPTFIGDFWVVLGQDNCVIPAFTGIHVKVTVNL